MNTLSCCSPFWVSINRCIKTNDGKKCPLSKSPFPLSLPVPVSVSIKDSCLEITGGWPRAGSTISIQQTTNNWHKLCHWQYSNSTFSLPPSPMPCPLPASSRLCSFTQCCLYIISPLCVSPSLCLHYWAGLMLSDVWLVPSLSPLIWQLCLAPDIIEEAGHYPAPQCPHIIVITQLPQYWSPPSHI